MNETYLFADGKPLQAFAAISRGTQCYFTTPNSAVAEGAERHQPRLRSLADKTLADFDAENVFDLVWVICHDQTEVWKKYKK